MWTKYDKLKINLIDNILLTYFVQQKSLYLSLQKLVLFLVILKNVYIYISENITINVYKVVIRYSSLLIIKQKILHNIKILYMYLFVQSVLLLLYFTEPVISAALI